MNTLDRTNSTAVAALDFNPTDARLRYANDDVSQTLTARARTGGNQVPLVQVQPLVFNPNTGITEKGGGFALSEDVTPTLKTDHNPAVAFASNQRDEVRELEVAGALAAQPGIKQQTYICRADGQANAMTSVDMAPTLTSHAKKDPPLIYPAEDSIGEDALIQRDMSATLSTHNTQTLITGGREKRSLTVRRLTPTRMRTASRFSRRLHRYSISKQGTRSGRSPIQGFRQQHGRTGHAMDWRTYSNGRRSRRNNRVDNRNRWIVAEEGATFLKKTIQR